MQMKLTPGVVLEKFRRRFPMFIYVMPIVILTVLLGTAFAYLAGWNQQFAWLRMILFIPLILAASHLAIAIANWLVTIMMSPQPLPKMDYSKGIPSEASTLVVVPTMLSSLEGIERLLENLEIRYLANRDPALHYALLTDFNDAATEVDQTDDALLQKARLGIGKLNAKHGKDRDALFFLLHRKRVWNAQEKIWMGYERKRGKLAALNGLLRGVTGDFLEPEGNVGMLQSVRYVITLDTDTQLPRDTALELVGAIAHPLNRAKFNSETNQISEGYTILQPRVGVSLPSAYRSWYVRLFGGDAGIDPYTRVVSDVYQDLFGLDPSLGKGSTMSMCFVNVAISSQRIPC